VLRSIGPALAVGCAVAVAVTGGVSVVASHPPVDARAIYLRDCASCHGPGGHGTSDAPPLDGWGAAGVDYALSSGRMPLSDPDAEPTRGDPAYDADTIDALVSYVDGLVPGGPPIPDVDPADGDLAAGGDVFRGQCAACHQWAGQGGALLHREAPPLQPATALQAAEAIRTGPGAMPVFSQAAIGDDDLDSLLRYVDALDDPDDRGGLALWHLGPVAEGGVALAAMAALMLVLRYVGSRR
jgi:quinol---cytochrome-c reductase cytochrome c subunit